ncbi:hypothetical protein PSECIP111951_02887 [Pseudoalteromonas holothuriae]|uniref:TauD/TfdA-like domain-containing protein n=1 Tax=Pseudoalteromonas holothuriae TaxID=2963714 RepID=A0A9W4QZE9_9GAMM|nr:MULTISPECIES: TauD/TfdA family dioxygenase [unclassified Pseudoalteromonas]CAH9060168.1 hypothetical protein PSECIP111854_02551 [Pseudoalteromonas sp. CIP111854]CAH9063358.1 hypothetical protein PSECIP111951_02887 [Pseudoalteromonas sp. CIP111951]
MNQQLTSIEYPVELNGLSLMTWIEQHQDAIRQQIETHGAILLRGLNIISSAQFGKIISHMFSEELLSYTNRSTPRKELKGNVYTSTEYPPEESIPLHNENAYSHEWPMKLAFLCLVAPSEEGETPIADSRKIYDQIPAHIREKFEQKGVMYLRNYDAVGLPWREVFQVETKAEAEAYCIKNDIQFEWLDDDGLRTRQICPAVQTHPITGEKIWFNQAHLFHVSNHDEANRKALEETFSTESLPRHSFYGDGEPIEEEYLAVIRQAFLAQKVKFTWQRGDLMIIDNMLYCHGRQPYKGNRRILVSMVEANTLAAQAQRGEQNECA